MFTSLETQLLLFAHQIPLEWFVLFASMVEEIVAPIPSSATMLAAGSIAALKSYSYFDLLVLSCLGALGKTAGAYIVYVIVDRAEDVLLGKFGAYFSIRHEDVENLGKKLTGGFRDYLILIGLRALPIVPSVILSVGGGLLKIKMRLFLVSTFFGTIFRDGFYLLAGFAGFEALVHFVGTANQLEHIVEIGFIGLCIIGGIFWIKKKKKV